MENTQHVSKIKTTLAYLLFIFIYLSMLYKKKNYVNFLMRLAF